jgi:hypothetical protein
MATVTDFAHPEQVVDRPYTKHNRVTAADPNTVLTPLFHGEIVLDTANKKYWISTAPANNAWITHALYFID